MSNNKPPFMGERVPLNSLCSKGKSTLRQKDLNIGGLYPVYGASGIIGYMDTYQNEREYIAVVKDGAGVGRATICPSKSSVLGTMQALLPNEGVECRYLLHLVRALNLGSGFSGSTIPHIYYKDYGKRLVPSFSLERQKNISARFEKIESLIDLGKQALECCERLVKSQFVEMFGTANERLCEYVSLEDICSAIVDCPHETPKYNGDLQHPAIRTSELVGTTINWETMKYVSHEEYLRRTKRLAPLPGDVVYAREGTYGNAAVLPEGHEFCLGQRTMLFRPDGNICSPVYFLYALTSTDVRRQADELNVGSTVPHINVRDAKRFLIPLPSIELQSEFAFFVSEVDKSRFVARKSAELIMNMRALDIRLNARLR